MAEAAIQAVEAIDYQPSASGPFMWQAFDAVALDADLTAIAAAGFRVVRVGLAWDSFMPDAGGVDQRRLRELGTMLQLAVKHSLQVIPVLFVQSHGDCVLLPARTVLRRSARPGVRVLSEGRLEPGAPRDPWTDTLMLELADRWLRALAGGFANHPAIAAWDLGDDPARTLRPRHIPDLSAWVDVVAEPLRSRGDRVHLTLGAGDVMRARGVRLDGVAARVDRLDLAVRSADLQGLGLNVGSAAVMLAQIAQRLIGDTPGRLGMALAVPTGGDSQLDEPAAAAATDELLSRVDESGILSLRPTRWRDLGGHLADRPPFDRGSWMLSCGLVGVTGTAKESLTPWRRALRDEVAAGLPQPWPAHLDPAEYYANLPDSLLDLAEAWRRERNDQPGILDRQ